MAVNLAVQIELSLVAPPVFVDADASGHTFANSGSSVAIWFDNSASGVAKTATFLNGRDSDFGDHPDWTFTIPANEIVKTPTWDARRFTNPATGLVTFTLSSVAGLKVAAVAQGTIYRNS